MEKLILKCGRFLPREGLDSTVRLRSMEQYLAKLTEELEYTAAELDRTLRELGRISREAEGTAIAVGKEETV